MTEHLLLDHARTTRLAKRLMEDVLKHSRQAPPSPELTYEALNALAFTTASVLTGTGPHPDALEFFFTALRQALDEIAELESESSHVGHA